MISIGADFPLGFVLGACRIGGTRTHIACVRGQLPAGKAEPFHTTGATEFVAPPFRAAPAGLKPGATSHAQSFRALCIDRFDLEEHGRTAVRECRGQ